jgi:Fe-S cluster biogenesis protein NfuA
MAKEVGDSRQIIEDALSNFRVLVAADGGEINFNTYTADSRVDIDYKMGTNEECPGCVITPEDLAAFVKEAVTARGLPVSDVLVNAV